MSSKQKNILVIGGGPAGLVITSVAAQLGLNVTLIEKKSALGGDCLHYGCVPSKALIKSAKVAHEMRHGQQFGLSSIDPNVDLNVVNQRVKSIIAQIQKHDDPDRFRSYGAEVIFGEAKFLDPHTISVNGENISAKRIVLTMGARAAIPPIPGLDTVRFLTNETIFQLTQLPKHLIVLGGGVIGVELAQAFSRFGSQVTIIEMADQLLPMVDQDIAACLQARFKKSGIVVHAETRVESVEQNGAKISVHCTNKQGQNFVFQGDQLLVATGRMPNVDGINLPLAKVDFNTRGILVDARLRTSQKHIYAAGDVVDMPYKFTHMAEYHAGIVISNVIFKFPKKVDYRVAPSVIYTDPEIAMVGLNERQAKENEQTYQTEIFPFSDIDRAIVDSNTEGFIKILFHKGKILGASIIGPNAGELISEWALALQANLKLSQISNTIHAYPTLAQIHRRVANRYFTPKLFNPLMKKVAKFLNRF